MRNRVRIELRSAIDELYSLTARAAATLVSTVTATSPIASSGGLTPNISLLAPAISTAVSTSTTSDDQFVEVTATPGVVVTILAAHNRVTIKDRTGNNNPLIGVTSAVGTIEDPNNLGTFVAAGTTVLIKQPGGAVSWRKNAAGNYAIVSST